MMKVNEDLVLFYYKVLDFLSLRDFRFIYICVWFLVMLDVGGVVYGMLCV